MTSTQIEYRVRPITRWVVTRYSQVYTNDGVGRTGESSQRGEYGNYDVAYEVATALCKAEHEALGYPAGDERIIYPPHHPADAVREASLGVPYSGPIQSGCPANPAPFPPGH